MRILFAVPLLALAACNVENDPKNDQLSVEYNEQRIKEAADDAGKAAREVASGVANVAETTGQAVKNEVGDIDVDVNVNRTERQETK